MNKINSQKGVNNERVKQTFRLVLQLVMFNLRIAKLKTV